MTTLKIGRYEVVKVVEDDETTYSVIDADGDEVDWGYSLQIEAQRAAMILEADAVEEEKQERLSDLRSEISDLMDGCEDEELLRKIKALLS